MKTKLTFRYLALLSAAGLFSLPLQAVRHLQEEDQAAIGGLSKETMSDFYRLGTDPVSVYGGGSRPGSDAPGSGPNGRNAVPNFNLPESPSAPASAAPAPSSPGAPAL